MLPFTITPRGVSFIIEGKPQNILKSHPNYDDIVDAIKINDINALKDLCDLKKFVSIASEGNVEISEDEVRYKGIKVTDYLAERIIYYFKNDLPIKPICNFTEKLMGNPNHELREDLFKWLENGDMPICSNGNFIAYKAVKPDFTPVHKGPYGQDQSVGKTVTMPREKCDSDRNRTCSSGLHFCSWEYIPSFTSGYFSGKSVIIILEINPEDVVAIPTDYNLSKGRCCEFKVIGTVNNEEEKEELQSTDIYDKDIDIKEANKKIESGRLYPVEFKQYLAKKLIEQDEWKFNGALMIKNTPTDDNSPKVIEKSFFHRATGNHWSWAFLKSLKFDEGLTYNQISHRIRVPKGTIEGWFKKMRESV